VRPPCPILLLLLLSPLWPACVNNAAPLLPADQDTDQDTDRDHTQVDEEELTDQETHREPWRPQYHYSPDEGWMNDPNGLVWYNGHFHLFYQYAPAGFFFDKMHWGHAVSSDGIHWETREPALLPDDELGNVYSGSVVVDQENRSGLCLLHDGDPSCLVALFTHSGGTAKNQKQSLAYSNDDGESWTMHPDNPVLANPGLSDFRDPRVFWHGDSGRFVMVLSGGERVLFYTSADLIHWQEGAAFDPGFTGQQGPVECPELLRLPVPGDGKTGEVWMLKVDVFSGGPYEGSASYYFMGDFDGAQFTPMAGQPWPKLTDAGKDFYAAQSFSGIPPDDQPLWLAWMNNWDYALLTPTEPFKGSMTLPRRLWAARDSLGRLYLAQRPLDETTLVQGNALIMLHEFDLQGDLPLSMEHHLDCFSARIRLMSASDHDLGLRLSNDRDQEVRVGYNGSTRRLYVDRRLAGNFNIDEGFTGLHSGEAPPGVDVTDLLIYVDKASVEIFLGDGGLVVTDLLLPDNPWTSLTLYCEGDPLRLREVVVFPMQSIWR